MKTIFLSTLTKAINNYIGLDPESKLRLQLLQGKVITIELLPFHFIFHLTFINQRVEIHANEEDKADTKICGTPVQLLGMMLNKDNRQHFFADDLKIEGDAEVGQNVVDLFDEIHIDWEDALSRLIGDVPAFQTGRFIRGIGKWLRQTKNTFADNINEYVHEEVKLFPSSEALKDFYNEIDHLRMDTDRIEAKIMHIKETIMQLENK